MFNKSIPPFRLLKKTRILIHANLAIALLLAQLVFVTGINAQQEVMYSLLYIEYPYVFFMTVFQGVKNLVEIKKKQCLI